MKSIILTPHELRSAIDGRLTRIVRAMKKQPPSAAYGLSKRLGDNNRWLWYDRSDVLALGIYFDCPFSPGETAFVKETHCIEPKWIDNKPMFIPWGENPLDNVDYKIDGDLYDEVCWRSPATMPQWASRYHITFGEVEVKQAKDVKDLDLKADPDTWLWVWTVEVNKNGN